MATRGRKTCAGGEISILSASVSSSYIIRTRWIFQIVYFPVSLCFFLISFLRKRDGRVLIKNVSTQTTRRCRMSWMRFDCEIWVGYGIVELSYYIWKFSLFWWLIVEEKWYHLNFWMVNERIGYCIQVRMKMEVIIFHFYFGWNFSNRIFFLIIWI